MFVLTSFYEPFGLAPIEAVACGLSCGCDPQRRPFRNFRRWLRGPRRSIRQRRYCSWAWRPRWTGTQNLPCGARERVLASYTWEKTAANYLSVIEEGVDRGFGKGDPVPALDAAQRIKAYLN